jgi:uncharacterized protein (DUF885 family)
MHSALKSLPIALILVSAACTAGDGPDADMQDGADTASASQALAALAERYWEWHLETSPRSATSIGDRRYDDRLADITPAGRERRYGAIETFLAELRTIGRENLAGQDLITYLALEEELQDALDRRVCRLAEWRVDHRSGPQVSLLNLADIQRVETPADGEKMVRRWRAMGPFVDAYIQNLRLGLADGLVANRLSVQYAIEQLRMQLEKPDDEWPLAEPAAERREGWSEGEHEEFGTELLAAIGESVRPAFQRLLDFFEQELLPVARTGDKVGMVGLAGGEECYRILRHSYTTLDLSAEEIHEIGLQENARIRAEMAALGGSVFGTSDVSEIQRRLRTDPALHFSTSAEVKAKAEEATARAEAAIPDWFGRLPETPIVVEEIPEYEAPFTTIAYYRRPAADGTRPGTYFINTYAPETRPRYDAEVLAYHEGIPGHHLQLAIAQELTDIPEFRKYQGATAFVEGWALYTERLADEMGLYDGDLDRLGVLSFDAWRASRLVVDTGIHAFGWTREQAIDYMLENTLLAENNVENEVDRYISWPGQALAYKLGQREILRLRDQAKEVMGPGFEIKTFHDRVLENGAVSLAVLATVIEEWLAEEAAGS